MKKLIVLVILALAVYTVNADMASDVKALQEKVKLLKQYRDAGTTYCSTHANGNCGPCLCRDDRKLQAKHYCDCRNQTPLRDCLDFHQKGFRINGIYQITLNSYRKTQVYCDQTGNGGGWTVIQRRMDGSENFYRNWAWYKRGFGKLQREFWLGNENIHLLTAQAIYPKGSEAWIAMRGFGRSSDDNNRYSHFQVDSERSKYMLQVSGASGSYTPSNLVSYNHRHYFSTYDRDNDGSSSYNCARNYNFAGWWFAGISNSCTNSYAYVNLNGPYDKYRKRSWYQKFQWNTLNLESSEIKVRRLP